MKGANLGISKASEKAARTKYIRNLEKFYSAAVLALKKENFDEKLFCERAAKNAQIFDKSPAVQLNSTYTKELERFVNACLNFTSQSELVSLANALSKLKNAQNYKKDKHKKRANDDSSDF